MINVHVLLAQVLGMFLLAIVTSPMSTYFHLEVFKSPFQSQFSIQNSWMSLNYIYKNSFEPIIMRTILTFQYFVLHCVYIKPIRTFVSFSMPLEQHELPTMSTTISPSIGSIKLNPTLDVGGQQSCIIIISLNHHHRSSFKDTHEAPSMPKTTIAMLP